jgi:hypothetical protein
LDLIEGLPPGLYEMILGEKKAERGKAKAMSDPENLDLEWP